MQTNRYRHYIEPLSRDYWPHYIVCVGCDGCDSSKTNQLGSQVESLDRWYAALLELADDGYVIVREQCGNTASSWWQSLCQIPANRGPIWIISYDCARVWHLLDLWCRIECGDVLLSIADYRDADNQSSSDSARNRGYIVCERGVNIARVALKSAASVLTWIDSTNLGLTLPGNGSNAQLHRRQLVDYVRLLKSLADTYNLGSMCCTIGSWALRAYKRGYVTEPIYCHCNPVATKLEEQSLHGGRCEVRQFGRLSAGSILLDYRLLYGSICATNYLPVRLVDTVSPVSENLLYNSLLRYMCIGDLSINTPEPAYPLKRDGITVYPVGRFRTTLSDPELRDAARYERIARVHSLARYRPAKSLSPFASVLIGAITSQNLPISSQGEAIIKSLLVSLPGKFSQRHRAWITELDGWSDVLYGTWYGLGVGGKLTRYRAIGGVVQREVVGGYSYDASPAIASYVASAGRMALLSAVRCAGWENTYYLDTDALIVNQLGRRILTAHNYCDDYEPGKLRAKISGEVIAIHGIKHYSHGDIVVCAGQRNSSESTASGDHTLDTRYSPGEQIRAGVRPDGTRYHHSVVNNIVYRHGVVQYDGSVKPLEIYEW